MSDNNPWGTDYWDGVARGMNGPIFQEQIALYKRKEYIDLISAWIPSDNRGSMLKTDLFEEAFGRDSLIDTLGLSYPLTVSIDISGTIVMKAKERLPAYPFLVGNICRLPFKEESFDFVLSNSTLDHLPIDMIPDAINELWRVLKQGGCMILTLDSRHNPLHLLSHYIRRWMGGYHEEHCFTIQETTALLDKGRFHVSDVTAIYHIPPGINFMAKMLYKAIGPHSDRLMQYIINIFHKVGQLPTRFITGRYIALRAVKAKESEYKEKGLDSDRVQNK